MRNELNIRRNNKGQAVTEYILVLTVLLFVFLILLQINQQFRKWGEDYFVAYYRCLLETGEVPSLGGENTTGGICSNQFQPFTFTAGWQPLPGQNGNGSGGDGSGGRGNGNGNGNGAGTNGQDPSQKATNEGSSGGSRGAEVSRVSRGGSGSSRFGRFQKRRDPSGGAEGANKKKKKGIYTGSNATTNFSTKKNRSLVRRKKEGLKYGFGISRVEEERGEERSTVSLKKESQKVQNKKRMKIVRAEVKKKVEVDDEGFTIGGFFRILIIAAIIIALGVLIGGQLLQISKGMDAEG